MSTFTATATIDEVRRIKHILGGDMMYVLKISFASGDDAAAPTITLKSTKADPGNAYNAIMDQLTGSWLYLMKTVPGSGGAAPTAAFDVDIEDKLNHHILDTDSNSETAYGFVAGSDTLGVYPPIMEEITVVSADLGDANTADIYLYFLK